MFGPVIAGDEIASRDLKWYAARAAGLSLDALCAAQAAMRCVPDGHPLAFRLETAAGELDSAVRELKKVQAGR